MSAALLSVQNLQVSVRTPTGFHPVVRDLSFDVQAGETLAIVGESGCGKSITALAILGLLPRHAARVDGGQIRFDGHDLLALDDRAMSGLRGNRIAMIFQEPMTSLNPVMRVGEQIAEAVRLHRGVGQAEAWREALAMLDRVRLPDAARRAAMYPHQLSGGMRQRVMIAMALVCRPQLIIADEPTTALDVTIQAQILALLAELQRDFGTAVVLITHDLAVVCESADRVVVLYAGRAAESATVAQVFDAPAHPYTRGLMASIPRRALQSGATRLHEIAGVVPAPDRMPPGCAFASRCPNVQPVCRDTVPPHQALSPGHQAACWNPDGCA